MSLFNNREIALAIWTVVAFVLLLGFAPFRKCLVDIIRAFSQRFIFVGVGLMLLYTAVIMVPILYAFNLWNVSLLKETIYWFCFVAPVLVYRFTSSQQNENVVSRIIADNVKIIIILELVMAVVINAYTFPLGAELVLTLVVSTFVLAEAWAQAMGFASSAKFAGNVLALIGFGLLLHAGMQAMSDPDFWTIDTVHRIILFPLLSILFAPFIYLILLDMKWENRRIRAIHRSS